MVIGTQLEILFLLFFSAAELRDGLDRPRWAQFKQAKLFCNYANETLRDIEVRVTRYGASERLLTDPFCAALAATTPESTDPDADGTSPQADQFLMRVRRSRCLWAE